MLVGHDGSTLYKLYAVRVRVCSTREDMHYPWVISSVPVKLSSISVSYPQYPWGYAVPMSHILSTRESYPQYGWGYAAPVSHILSTRERMQYLWGYAVPVREISFIHINLLTGTTYPHGYWGYDFSVSYMSSGLVWRWQKSDPKRRL